MSLLHEVGLPKDINNPFQRPRKNNIILIYPIMSYNI